MLNQVVLVGRLVTEPELHKTENEKENARLVLAVTRSYKNENGEYETDFIPCTTWGTIAHNTVEYCKKGDLIGIRGRIETYNFEVEDGKKYITEVVAEKITFLSSKKKEEPQESR